MYELNFLAYAVDKKSNSCYEDFLIPFTFFCLFFNKNSHVEIIVLDPDNFKKKYEKEIESIKAFNHNFLIRKSQYKLNNNIPNTYRFFESPTVPSKYTYISDIDIMFLEEILPNYIINWPDNLPYNNIIRETDRRRLTGVMMIINDRYYTREFKRCQEKYYSKNTNENDEVILSKLCKEIHGLPDMTFRYRPILGIHFSPNRGRNKCMNLETTDKYNKIFLDITKKYPQLFEYKIFNQLLKQLSNDFIINNV